MRRPKALKAAQAPASPGRFPLEHLTAHWAGRPGHRSAHPGGQFSCVLPRGCRPRSTSDKALGSRRNNGGQGDINAKRSPTQSIPEEITWPHCGWVQMRDWPRTRAAQEGYRPGTRQGEAGTWRLTVDVSSLRDEPRPDGEGGAWRTTLAVGGGGGRQLQFEGLA